MYTSKLLVIEKICYLMAHKVPLVIVSFWVYSADKKKTSYTILLTVSNNKVLNGYIAYFEKY